MGKCTDGTACAKFDYRGVLFSKGAPDSVLRTIETDLTQYIIQVNGADAANLNDFIFANLKRYDAFITDFPKYNIPWEWRITQQVNYNKNKFVGISTLGYSYTGGDAGMTQIFFRNYDIVTGNALQYSKLFNAGFEDALKPLLKSKLEGAVPKEVWTKTAAADNVAILLAGNNFRFSDEGLVMLFSPLLDSKLSGPYEILLPWKELTGVLRPNFEKRLI